MDKKPTYQFSRRGFIKLGTMASIPLCFGGLAACSGKQKGKHPDFEIIIQSNYPGGHQLMDAQNWPIAKELNTKTLIAGGGLAGLSAAASLTNNDFLLFELGANFGGTSSASSEYGMPFTQGAHYDLAYPAYYGSEVLELLAASDIINFNSLNQTWEFTDKRFLIPSEWENNVVVGKTERGSVLPDIPQTSQFAQLLEPYIGKMLMPVRNMDEQLKQLDNDTFSAYLERNLGSLHPELQQAIDHQMLDDYGGTSNEISALAGIHYYTCRPYHQEDLELFSPPQGNYYFVEKLLQKLTWSQLYPNHLVSAINKTSNGYESQILDIANKKRLVVKSEHIVYAGKKHALRYIHPDAVRYYNDLNYAPWVTINFILDNQFQKQGIWQNEWLGKKAGFMGFVDSDSQFHKEHPKRIFTAYYCLKPGERVQLQSNDFLRTLTQETLELINQYFQVNLNPLVERAYVKPMGHAMAIPTAGFITKDRFETETFKMAGVDNGRLPLLFEAMDSGIVAAHKLNKL